MIDRHALAVDRIECDDVVVHALRKVAQRVELRARRKTGIGDPVGTVEHHAAGTFQEVTVILVLAEIDNVGYLPAPGIVQSLDDIEAALCAAIFRFHRVEHDAAVGMHADPVVRENGVGRVRVGCVVNDNDLDAGIT